MKEETVFQLPETFLNKMKCLLGETEYEEFLKSYEKERIQGLRLNPLKWSMEWGEEAGFLKTKFNLRKIPWAKEGYYYEADTRPGKHPLHEAGAYYIQEPSAMAVAELLDPKPGERILGLCAAPGGKTTQIAGRMNQQGILVSNEIHPARAKILSQNVERMGIANCVVTNEDSHSLLSHFPEFFDKIVVDAPCSGEGMFRKDEQARQEWSLDNVKLCAARQMEILDNAAGMLKRGGRLVYSTCTFSPEENEGSIQAFLSRHPEFAVEAGEAPEGFEHFGKGRPEWAGVSEPDCEADLCLNKELSCTFRIWPHRTEGEGHYLACLRKSGEQERMPEGRKGKRRTSSKGNSDPEKETMKIWKEFENTVLSEHALGELLHESSLITFGDHIYALPSDMVSLKGLKVLRPGLDLGVIKKNRFEPSHALALYLKKEQARQWFSMPGDRELIQIYLRGETIDISRLGEKEAFWNLKSSGWVLMMTENCSAGWAKLVGNTLKNHYPKGLRRP